MRSVVNSTLRVLVVSIILLSCKKNKAQVDLPILMHNNKITGMKEIFGFYGDQRYSYGPSVIILEDGTKHMFFIGNPNNPTPGSSDMYSSMIDHIYHIRINKDGSQTAAKSVLQPTANAWDSRHDADPSVIAGDFKMNGNNYKYAMFFLGNRYDRYFNEVGVAFSNDLEANQWVKYPKQLIEKTWSGDLDFDLPNNARAWGVGQPTAISLDKKGKVLLAFTIGDVISTRQGWIELDMSNMDNLNVPSTINMNQKGLKEINGNTQDYIANIDLALSADGKNIIMIRPVHPHPTDYPNFLNKSLEINYMPLDAFKGGIGNWNTLIRITPEMTGYQRNHNAALERDEFGHMGNNWKEPNIYYTTSKTYPDVYAGLFTHAEWTYRIWEAQIRTK